MSKLGTQGAAEGAHLLFTGTAYVPYGDGQRPVELEETKAQKEQTGMEMDQPQIDGCEM